MSLEWSTQWNEGGPSGLGYSELEAYLRCPKEYQFAAIRKLGKPVTAIPDYFAEGGLLHAGRAAWMHLQFDLGLETWTKVQAAMQQARESWDLPMSERAWKNSLNYMTEYIDHWGMREKPKIVAVEHMLGPVKLDGDNTERTARLDDFGFYDGALRIGECKTTSGSVNDVVNQYELHGQPVLQQLLWSLAPQGEAMYGPVAGTMLDVVVKGANGKKCEFARIQLDVTPHTKQWVAAELSEALRKKSTMTWDSKVERRVTSCTRLIGKARIACPYRDVCQHGRAGALGMKVDGVPVQDWQPSEGKTAAPWE